MHSEQTKDYFSKNKIKKINPGLANKDYKFGLQTEQTGQTGQAGQTGQTGQAGKTGKTGFDI